MVSILVLKHKTSFNNYLSVCHRITINIFNSFSSLLITLKLPFWSILILCVCLFAPFLTCLLSLFQKFQNSLKLLFLYTVENVQLDKKLDMTRKILILGEKIESGAGGKISQAALLQKKRR